MSKVKAFFSRASRKVSNKVKNIPAVRDPKDFFFNVANKTAHSYWYDILGCAIVILGCAAMGYFGETAGNASKAWKLGLWIAHNPVAMAVGGAAIPIGILSVISALMSLESDRFESRLSNIGNWIGIVSVLTTMYVDWMFGNLAAPYTYSITMVIQIIATVVWHYKGKYEVNKPLHGLKDYSILAIISVASFALAYWSDEFGFGNQPHDAIFWASTLAFTISMIANLAEMFKLQFNNKAWIIYNLIQLYKALVQGNFANVYKIGYYLVNNVISIVSWSDKGRSVSSKAEAHKAAKKASVKLA